MSRSGTICTLMLGGFLTLPWAVWAKDGGGWGRGPGRGPEFGGRMFALLENDRFKTELGLTDQQAEKLRQVFVDSWKANTKSRADLQVRRMELRELLRGDKPEREAVMKKVQEISDLRAQLLRQHVDSLLAAKSVLTPEQQKKMRSLMADRGFGRSERFQRRPGFRGGPGDPGGPGAPEGPRMPVAPEPPED